MAAARGGGFSPGRGDREKTCLKAFLDTNVLLDFLVDRKPFADYAHRLFALAERGQLTLCVSSLSVCNVYYVLRKLVGAQSARELTGRPRLLTEISPVSSCEIKEVLRSPSPDFEDAVQIASARMLGGVDARNPKDFALSTLPVKTPEEYLKVVEP